MKNKTLPADMLLNQIEDALEERQSSDRRKTEKGLPAGINQDRRKEDRRSRKKNK